MISIIGSPCAFAPLTTWRTAAGVRDLSEAVVYQKTGSGNILRVIASSPTDAPVLKAIVESASYLRCFDPATMLRTAFSGLLESGSTVSTGSDALEHRSQ
jgi:hypothetical protein